MNKLVRSLAVAVACAPACSADDGYTTREDGLTVGGYHCPQGAGDTRSDLPPDGVFFISTFEGGSPMSCHRAAADGVSLYIADRDRWPCDTHVRLVDPRPLDPRAAVPQHMSCVALVADRGPNICVEEAAGKAMIDASPALTRYIYGVDSSGWSDHREVIAFATDDPIGCAPVGEDILDADGGAPDAGVADGGTCRDDLDCDYWQYCATNGTCTGLSCGNDDTACNAGLSGLGIVCGNAGACTPGCHSDVDCEDAQTCDTASGDGVCR
jgi:hypothetical protein